MIRHLEKCNRILLGYKRECENYVVYENIGTLIFALTRLAADLDEYLQKSPDFPERREVNEFYLNLRNFMNIYELVDEHYVVYSEHEEDGRFKLKFYCGSLPQSAGRIDKGNATIFSRLHCFRSSIIKACCPPAGIIMRSTRRRRFPRNSACCCLEMTSAASTRGVAGQSMSGLHKKKKNSASEAGNYMVFFPSYRMMQEVYDVF